MTESVINCIWEHNGADTLLYAGNFPGAYTRGASLEEALRKMPGEIASFLRWLGQPAARLPAEVVQEQASSLQICDGDSEVIFQTELEPLRWEEYLLLKERALKSAADFLTLYRSIPEPDRRIVPERQTFYGKVPGTANEVYLHTKNVNNYYFGEIQAAADNEGSILECRERGFERLEQCAGFLERAAVVGSYDEKWSLRKVLRRFVWHDRIHAKCLYRRAASVFGQEQIADVFHFADA